MATVYLQRLRDEAGSQPTKNQQSGISKVIKTTAKHRGTVRQFLSEFADVDVPDSQDLDGPMAVKVQELEDEQDGITLVGFSLSNKNDRHNRSSSTVRNLGFESSAHVARQLSAANPAVPVDAIVSLPYSALPALLD